MHTFVFLLLCPIVNFAIAEEPKNVIVIMADDMALHDASFRGSSEILTPNIDALAYQGIILNRFYTPPLCSPSRASFLTGKYPHSIGMQEQVILPDEPYGLPLDEKIMPQYFKEAGYSTHLVGKWHVGFFKQAYTPTRRGYDSFLGYLGPYLDYFDFTQVHYAKNYSRGYDLRRNFEVERNVSGQYLTKLFTDEAVKIIKNHDKLKPLFLQINHIAPHTGNTDDPMQALNDDISKFSYIKDPKRKILAAMIHRLDLGVGEVVKALKDAKMLQNSIVVFFSDNGGPTTGIHSNAGSNYPLRGQKESAWEGAVRTNAIIYAPFLPKNTVKDEFFHITDLLPTLRSLSKAKFSIESKIDGIDQSWVLKSFFPLPFNYHPRKEIIFIDDVNNYANLILNGYKLVNGSTFGGAYDTWLGVNNDRDGDVQNYEKNVRSSMVWEAINSRKSSFSIQKARFFSKVNCNVSFGGRPCDPLKSACLFDILNDPCETNDLSKQLPGVFNDFMKRLNYYESRVVPSKKKQGDPRADPKFHNYTWTWWQDE